MLKDIGGKNPIFSPQHIEEIYNVFALYADPRQRRSDVRDILLTASTLGIDSKNELVYRVLQEIHEATSGNALDFESFLRELTNKIVVMILFRATLSMKKAERLISPFLMPKIEES